MTFMGKRLGVVTSKFLDRIGEPASRFHSDYLAYRNGEIKRTELIMRLPHVAMVGDSACMGIYVSSIWSTFWRARTCSGNNWFLDTLPPASGIQSVSKRLEEITPLVAIECAGIGALVDREGEPPSFFRRILRTRNFSGQIGDLLAMKRFPDLILVSIGHNNVDWAWRSSAAEREQPGKRLKQQSQDFRKNFTKQLRQLTDCAQVRPHRVAIVVYGLIDFESYFRGHESAERLRASNPSCYPRLEIAYRYFTSFRPAYRSNLIRLAKMLNEELCASVGELGRELVEATVQLRYSDALAKTDLSRAELLHPIDGWHASVEGHNLLAGAAFRDLGPSLEFLGIKPPFH